MYNRMYYSSASQEENPLNIDTRAIRNSYKHYSYLYGHPINDHWPTEPSTYEQLRRNDLSLYRIKKAHIAQKQRLLLKEHLAMKREHEKQYELERNNRNSTQGQIKGVYNSRQNFKRQSLFDKKQQYYHQPYQSYRYPYTYSEYDLLKEKLKKQKQIQDRWLQKEISRLKQQDQLSSAGSINSKIHSQEKKKIPKKGQIFKSQLQKKRELNKIFQKYNIPEFNDFPQKSQETPVNDKKVCANQSATYQNIRIENHIDRELENIKYQKSFLNSSLKGQTIKNKLKDQSRYRYTTQPSNISYELRKMFKYQNTKNDFKERESNQNKRHVKQVQSQGALNSLHQCDSNYQQAEIFDEQTPKNQYDPVYKHPKTRNHQNYIASKKARSKMLSGQQDADENQRNKGTLQQQLERQQIFPFNNSAQKSQLSRSSTRTKNFIMDKIQANTNDMQQFQEQHHISSDDNYLSSSWTIFGNSGSGSGNKNSYFSKKRGQMQSPSPLNLSPDDKILPSSKRKIIIDQIQEQKKRMGLRKDNISMSEKQIHKSCKSKQNEEQQMRQKQNDEDYGLDLGVKGDMIVETPKNKTNKHNPISPEDNVICSAKELSKDQKINDLKPLQPTTETTETQTDNNCQILSEAWSRDELNQSKRQLQLHNRLLQYVIEPPKKEEKLEQIVLASDDSLDNQKLQQSESQSEFAQSIKQKNDQIKFLKEKLQVKEKALDNIFEDIIRYQEQNQLQKLEISRLKANGNDNVFASGNVYRKVKEPKTQYC